MRTPAGSLLRPSLLALLALLVLGAGLRLYNLTDRGIFDYDEAWFLLESKTLYDTGRYACLKATGSDTGAQSLKAFLKERGTVPITSGKIGHTLLILSSLLILGVHDYASFAVSALFGILTVFLIYRLGARLYGTRAGILSGLILAVSPLHIAYSRSGYAQASALFFLALGIYLWYTHLQTDHRPSLRLFCSGCAIGYAFTCHFNMLLFPPLFLLYEAIHIHKNRGRFRTLRQKLRPICILGAGLFAPPLLLELPFRAARVAGLLPPDQLTYFEHLSWRLDRTTQLQLENIPAVLEKFIAAEGLLIVLALFTGIYLVARKLRAIPLKEAVLLSLFILPAIPWTLLSVSGLQPLARNFAALFLPGAILSALGLMRISDLLFRQRAPQAALVLACLCVLASGLLHLKNLLPVHTAYRQATDEWLTYVDRHGGRIAFFPGSVWPIWYFYLSARYDSLPPRMKQRVVFYPGEKDATPPEGDFDAFDVKRYLRSLALEQENMLAYAGRLQSGKPVIRVYNPLSDLPLAYTEGTGDAYRKLWENLREFPSARYIEIYDLRTGPPLGRSEAPNNLTAAQ